MSDSSTLGASQHLSQAHEIERRYQQQSFQVMLRYVWKHSLFYRDYYGSRGIREKDLAEIIISDLPLLSKQILMENFDGAVTDSRLKKKELERWIQDNRDPFQDFDNEFIVTHSSGSSGRIGISVYDQKAWRVANSTMASHLPMPENYPVGKTRAAFYLVSHGRFGGVSTAARLPKDVYDTLILSVLDSPDHIVEQLNAFQPHRLHGYSSSISMLAELALQGTLRIQPQSIIVSGDKLTATMEERIQEAWRPGIYVLYSASESKYIAFKKPGQEEMTVLDDLNIVEVLDENNRSVSSREEGRVVLTNLYNYTLPVLRYELGDCVVVGTWQPDSPLRTIRDIKGRVEDALPVVLQDGRHDSVYPLVLNALYAPGLEKIQFISQRPSHVRIDYIAEQNIDTAIREDFQRMLNMKGPLQTTFEVRRVEHIANDRQTGKLRLVKIEHDQAYQHSESTPDLYLKEAVRADRVCPPSPAVEFKTEEVEESVPVRFEQQVAKYPNQLAIKTGNCALTYDALNRAANRVAHAVLPKSAESEEPIVLLLDHDAQMIVAILAILKTGNICVVLDASYPEARASYILEDSQAKLIVTNNKNLSLARKFAQPGHQLINLDEIDPNLSTENLGLSISPSALAFILYTSGSTGQPKGVIHNHRNVIHNAMRYANGCRIGAEDRVTLLASLGTGQATPTAFSALLSGATIYPYNIREEGVAGLSNWLKTEEITVYISAPTLFRQFVGTVSGDEKFPKLRMIRLGAEQVQKRDVDLYQKHFSAHCTLAIFLSATEAGNLCQYFVNKDTEIPGATVPVGYPVDGVEILLLDDAGKKVGCNETGEIAVKSRYLSPGYWRKPELTKAAFLPDPKGGDERIYRTGDLGRMLPDSCLEHLGRKDSQVKVRGFRIELEEIEALLRKHPAIQEAIIEVREEESKDNRLIAYIVPAQGEAPTVSELCNYLKEKLPDYMVPSAFAFLDSLPLTPAGKVDRRALPEPGNARPELNAAYVPPRTPLEEEVAKIWAEVLSLDRVGIHDNFFELGGHSLLGVNLIAQIQRDLHVNLPVRALFEFPTIAQLAARIIATQEKGLFLQEETENSCLVNLGPGQSQTPLFCFPYIGGFRGDLLTFARLARLVGPDYSFYGLQARGTDGVSQPHRCLEEMGGDYIREIQALQPHGPYFLIAECFGASVAYETAQQLRARGEEVALLAFLDAKCSRQSWGLSLWRRHSARLRYRIQPISESWSRAGFHLREIQRLERGKRLRYFCDKTGNAILVITSVLRGETLSDSQGTKLDGGIGERQKSRHAQLAKEAYCLAVMRYRLRPYDGRITLLVNEEWYRSDPNLRWADLANGGVELRTIPGNHLTYITEHIQVLARELKECLDRASCSPTSGGRKMVAG
jgi:amino acid adenylation domain-containing protein